MKLIQRAYGNKFGLGPKRPGFRPREKKIMSTELIILIIVLVLLFGGGGGYYYSRRGG